MERSKPMIKKDQGIIFDIKHYAIHDGPGIRTTVFLKGCPLRCQWCANPESQQLTPEIMFDETLCQQCQACAVVCPNNAIEFKDNYRLYDRTACSACGQCARVCTFDAVELCGYSIDIPDLWKQIKDDRAFWDRSGGGVTLSGGEPLVQHDFAQDFLSLCQEKYVHTAIETCGHVPESHFKRVLAVVDLVIFDFKLENTERHKAVIGTSNQRIKNNLLQLLGSDKEALIRMPLIPGCNDTLEQVRNICLFLEKARKGVSFEILPYHRLGEKKYVRLGRSYELSGTCPPNAAQLKKIATVVDKFDLDWKVGGYGSQRIEKGQETVKL